MKARIRLRRASRRRGYALLEMMVSIVAFSTLLVGLGSTIGIATRGTDPRVGPAFNALAAGGIAEQIMNELRTATSVTTRTDKAIEFTLVRDGGPHTVRYEWSGTPGDPLTRRWDGGTAVTVQADVRECAFGYGLLTVPVSQDGALVPVESSELEIMQYETTTSLSEYTVQSNRWVGMSLRPTLDSDVVSWRITRVELRMRWNSWNQLFNVQLRTASGNSPTSNVIDSATLNSSSLWFFPVWKSVSFSSGGGLSPTDGVCLVVTASSGTPVYVEHRSSGVSAANQNYVDWNGTSWQTSTAKSLNYRIWGTLTTMQEGPPTTYNTYYLQRATLSLRAGSNTASRIQTGTPLLNTPQVSL